MCEPKVPAQAQAHPSGRLGKKGEVVLVLNERARSMSDLAPAGAAAADRRGPETRPVSREAVVGDMAAAPCCGPMTHTNMTMRMRVDTARIAAHAAEAALFIARPAARTVPRTDHRNRTSVNASRRRELASAARTLDSRGRSPPCTDARTIEEFANDGPSVCASGDAPARGPATAAARVVTVTDGMLVATAKAATAPTTPSISIARPATRSAAAACMRRAGGVATPGVPSPAVPP